jgi:hypothetical protein
MADQIEDPILKGIKTFEKGSSKLTTWTLSIIGGSILIIVDDSYFRPFNINCRYAYFLFLVGWILLGISLYYGFAITRHVMVSDLYQNKKNLLEQILERCNKSFYWQLRFFQTGLLTFGIWLALFLLWWIFADIPTQT